MCAYELAHLEIVAAIIHQLTKGLTADQLVEQGFGPYYIDHTTGIWPQAAGGIPFNACEFQSKGDVITDLHDYQRFGELLRITQEKLDSRNFYAFNPAFDMQAPSCQDQMRQM